MGVDDCEVKLAISGEVCAYGSAYSRWLFVLQPNNVHVADMTYNATYVHVTDVMSAGRLCGYPVKGLSYFLSMTTKRNGKQLKTMPLTETPSATRVKVCGTHC